MASIAAHTGNGNHDGSVKAANTNSSKDQAPAASVSYCTVSAISVAAGVDHSYPVVRHVNSAVVVRLAVCPGAEVPLTRVGVIPWPFLHQPNEQLHLIWDGNEPAVQGFDTVFNDSRPWRINIHKTIPRAVAAIAGAAAMDRHRHAKQSAF